MGKNPGKWIKHVIFGKKSASRSSHEKLSKENAVRKSYKDGNSKILDGAPMAEEIPNPTSVMSEPPSMREAEGMTAATREEKLQIFSGAEKSRSALNDQVTAQGAIETARRASDTPVLESVDMATINEADKLREESAAIKAQAVFRGFLARRAFRALRGFISLQALIRGHLIRRQAVASLLCLQAVIKFQALFRGHQVRKLQSYPFRERGEHSGRNSRSRLESDRRSTSNLVALGVSDREKVLTNAFARHLLQTMPKSTCLQIFSCSDEANSGWAWMERWMSAYPWSSYERVAKPPTNLKRHRTSDAGTAALEVENNERSKRSTRKSSNNNASAASSHDYNNSSSHAESEFDKPKRGGVSVRRVGRSYADPDPGDAEQPEKPARRNFRKSAPVAVAVAATEAANEQPQQQPSEFEAEKIKRNLKKVSSTNTVPYHSSSVETAAEPPEIEMEKVKRSLRKVSNSVLGLDSSADAAAEQPQPQHEAAADKIKRNLKKVSNNNPPQPSTEPVSVSDNSPAEAAEVPKRGGGGIKKAANSAAEIVSDNTQVESEMPNKRGLKKVSSEPVVFDNSAPESETAAAAHKRKMKKSSKPSNSSSSSANIVPEEPQVQSSAETSNDVQLDSEQQVQVEEIVAEQITIAARPVDEPPITTTSAVNNDVVQEEALAPVPVPVQKHRKSSVTNGDVTGTKAENAEGRQKSEAEAAVVEHKSGRRRSSFGNVNAKANANNDHGDNVCQNNNSSSSSLPSYMAATESAKAKLRGSARADVQQDKVNTPPPPTRRHSLPASASASASNNGRGATSASPRTQKLTHSAKSGHLNRSTIANAERPIHANEWKR